MKNRLIHIILITVLLFCMIPGISAYANETQNVFKYPVKPGTEEWSTLTTHDQMVQACQIPEDILDTMPTALLADSVINYPLLADMFLFNDFQQGFEAIFNQFNGIKALFAREDVGTVLLEKYQSYNIAVPNNWTISEKANKVFEIEKIEMLLAQQTVLDRLNDKQLNSLLSTARNAYSAKQRNAEIYAGLGMIPTRSIINNVSQRQYSARMYYDYVDTLTQTDAVEVIVMEAGDELTPEQIAWFNSYLSTNYPLATKLREPTRMYNCHSYAWHSQSTSNNKWMNQLDHYNNPNLSEYWTDGSYEASIGWLVGQKVFWVLGDHSGILSSVDTPYYNNRITSKWGAGCLVYHKLSYCPYFPGPNGTAYDKYVPSD